MRCKLCGKDKEITEILGVCLDCIRDLPTEAFPNMDESHKKAREGFSLPKTPPSREDGIQCGICSNKCRLKEGGRGYCGVRGNSGGELLPGTGYALAYTYLDPLPTNCCASWFCEGSKNEGNNLAVFFYGCNMNCLFCQNSTHKEIENAPKINMDEFISKATNKDISCICFFGGSPEPQLPFAIKASEEILKERPEVRVCWELNGNGNEDLLLKAAKLSSDSGGIMKIDIKAFNPNLNKALCGVYNEQTYINFKLIAEKFFSEKPMLSATTLLIPGYIDGIEVERIAKFIAEINDEIPYSLLVFHPDFRMTDLPATTKELADECYQAAKKYLKNVNIGNKHLLKSF